MDTPTADRVREAYQNNETGRELLLARNALGTAKAHSIEILGQSPTSLDSFCQIIGQLDTLSEQLKSVARVMKWTDRITVLPKSEGAPTCDT